MSPAYYQQGGEHWVVVQGVWRQHYLMQTHRPHKVVDRGVGLTMDNPNKGVYVCVGGGQVGGGAGSIKIIRSQQ